MELVRQTARKIEAGGSDQWLWKGRRVSIVDGSTSSMPDTPENQRAFPQANTQKIGLGFPVMRYVVLISLATGVVRDLAVGGCPRIAFLPKPGEIGEVYGRKTLAIPPISSLQMLFLDSP